MANYRVKVCRVIVEHGVLSVAAATEDDAREVVEANINEIPFLEWDFYEEREPPHVVGVEEVSEK
jgi:hypothetical protein